MSSLVARFLEPYVKTSALGHVQFQNFLGSLDLSLEKFKFHLVLPGLNFDI